MVTAQVQARTRTQCSSHENSGLQWSGSRCLQYRHESRHQSAMQRKRGPEGRFANSVKDDEREEEESITSGHVARGGALPRARAPPLARALPPARALSPASAPPPAMREIRAYQLEQARAPSHFPHGASGINPPNPSVSSYLR